MDSERITWAQIMAKRHQEAHEREEETRAWVGKVTEQLLNEQSKFLEDFSDADKRIFGLIK